MIIGHQRILRFFDNAINSKKLAQAYCFVGPEQTGKRAMARFIAGKLLNVGEKQLDTHPDFYYLAREENEKTGKMKKDISIAQARALKERIGSKSWLGGYKIAIIDSAELLNKESANALLKVLEEAREKTIFFLLTTDDNSLLPTIKSRCQLFYLSLVPDEEIKQGLIQLGYAQSTVSDAVKLAWGRPGRAIQLAQDEELPKEYFNEVKRWEKIIAGSFYQRLKTVADLVKDQEDKDNKEILNKLLEIWIMIWRDELLHGAPKSGSTPKQIVEFIDYLKQMQAMIRQNVNVKLLIEEMLLKIK